MLGPKFNRLDEAGGKNAAGALRSACPHWQGFSVHGLAWPNNVMASFFPEDYMGGGGNS